MSAATPLLGLAARSAWNRRFVLGLVALSIALSTLLLLGLERLRTDVRASFGRSVSGTDLIVGPRGGSVQLLLYAVFRIGQPTQAMSAASAEGLARHRAVAWVLPIVLGDTHHGHAVLGTTPEYFERYRYGAQQALRLAQGQAFGAHPQGLYQAVIGADVARDRGYALGQRIVLSHGDGAIADNDHDDHPFTVVGILAPTGTPVDRTVHVSLQSIEAIHLEWAGGAHLPGHKVGPQEAAAQDLRPRTLTAALVGLKNRAAVFAVQRDVAGGRDEPLMAILPGVALDELWDVVALGERGLQAVSALVAVVSLAGLVAVVLAGLNERRRELALLRAVGAGARHVLGLLVLEGTLVTALGVLAGAGLCHLAVQALGPWVQARYGIGLQALPPGGAEWAWMGAVLAGGMLASLLPGWRAYRLSLADGLSPRT